MTAWVGQYCIYVRDLERSVKFYEALGLACTSRTDLDTIKEAILENPDKGGKLQLAQKLDVDDAIEMADRILVLAIPARVMLEVRPTAAERADPALSRQLHQKIAAAMGDDEQTTH